MLGVRLLPSRVGYSHEVWVIPLTSGLFPSHVGHYSHHLWVIPVKYGLFPLNFGYSHHIWLIAMNKAVVLPGLGPGESSAAGPAQSGASCFWGGFLTSVLMTQLKITAFGVISTSETLPVSDHSV